MSVSSVRVCVYVWQLRFVPWAVKFVRCVSTEFIFPNVRYGLHRCAELFLFRDLRQILWAHMKFATVVSFHCPQSQIFFFFLKPSHHDQNDLLQFFHLFTDCFASRLVYQWNGCLQKASLSVYIHSRVTCGRMASCFGKSSPWVSLFCLLYMYLPVCVFSEVHSVTQHLRWMQETALIPVCLWMPSSTNW